MKDPTAILQKYIGYDLATSQENEGKVHCSGLYMANPTTNAIELHKRIVAVQKFEKLSNQLIMNKVIDKMKTNITELKPDLFYDGLQYFKHCCAFFFMINAVMIPA